MRLLILFAFLSFTGHAQADKTVWMGEIQANGAPSELVTLELNQDYKIKVSGFMNLGKWIQKREKLANDACYEFSAEKEIQKIEAIKNSLDINVCDGTFHADHIYESKPFTAKKNRLHFWVNDHDYDDNSGSFHVELIQKE
ncbi:MAG: hypothetical protein LW832_10310 [Parachlamydia sp.]|jgi:hypothetical protein|nr:hypothetical protein [Parachlamydia sp.]